MTTKTMAVSARMWKANLARLEKEKRRKKKKLGRAYKGAGMGWCGTVKLGKISRCGSGVAM